VQVSRQELLAARVIELGLARPLQGNRSSVIFAHHSALRFKRSPPPADRTNSLCRSSTTLALPAERVSTLRSNRECSRRPRTVRHRSATWTPHPNKRPV
jgi:hypothetical protein